MQIRHLDTSIIVEILRGRSEVARTRLAALSVEDVAVSEIVRAELLYGARRSARPDENREHVENFLRHLPLVPFSGESAAHYAAIRHALETAGLPIGPNDLLIAATARAAAATLVTGNVTEFARVPGLTIENWLAS